MYLAKRKLLLFLSILDSTKSYSMKPGYIKLVYLLVSAIIFLQVPIVIAGSSSKEKKTNVSPVSVTEAAKVKSKNEIAVEAADSLFQNFKLLEAGVPQEAFELAYTGYKKLLDEGLVNRSEVLTIADFSKPSSEKRLYVIDMTNGKLLYHTLVAHGRNSGLNYATNFSNKPESNKSSLGFYLTLQTYFGEKGLALKLKGLESGINDKAYERAIVLHGSDYVTSQFAANKGYIGRSLGCPAVPRKQALGIINTIKNGSVLFIYHPEKKYKEKSAILNS